MLRQIFSYSPPTGKEIQSDPPGMPGPPGQGLNIDWCITMELMQAANKGKLPTYPPSLKLTLTLISHLGQNVDLGRGRWAVSQKRIMIPMIPEQSENCRCEFKIFHLSIHTLLLSIIVLIFMQIKRRFENSSLKQRARTAHAYEFKRDFGQVLASQMVS